MSLKITFKNQKTGQKITGNAEWSDSINSIMKDLKEGDLISNGQEIFKKEDGTTISKEDTFLNLGIKEGDTIFFETEEKEKVPKFIKPIPPQRFHQLGIFVLDGSYSMNESDRNGMPKKEAVNRAMKGIISHFKKSSLKNNFSFCVLNFGENATEKLSIQKLDEIDEKINFDPTLEHNNNTLIYTGLEKAEMLATTFLAQETPDQVPHSVIIIVLSDGECHHPSQTISVANRIKKNAKIEVCTTFLETPENPIPAAEDLMKNVASEKRCFIKTQDEDSIRNFFIASTSTAS